MQTIDQATGVNGGMNLRRERSITFFLVILNVTIYLVMAMMSFSRNGINIYNTILIYGGISKEGLLLGYVYQPITALFLHGNIWHIAFNMFALYQLGFIVESIYGKWKYLAFYFIIGILGNIFAAFTTRGLIIGSSTAIFGLVGMLFTLGLRKDTPVALRSVTGLSLLPIILINLLLGFTVSGISNMAHIGGLVVGGLVGWLASPGYGRIKRRRVFDNVVQKSSYELEQDLLLKYVPIFQNMKELGQNDVQERKLKLGKLRSELSQLKDYDLSSKVLFKLFERDLITREEFENIRKFL